MRVDVGPTIFVVFGVTGDLAGRKLLPALLNLSAAGLMPKKFHLIGVSRRSFSQTDFATFLRQSIKPVNREAWSELEWLIGKSEYVSGQFDDTTLYSRILETVRRVESEWGLCANKLLYLAVPPTLYEPVLTQLGSSPLRLSCSGDEGWTRLLIEKPFGSDPVMANRLEQILAKTFKEHQVYRIDHYLAKEALQNVLAFRFVNRLFEPLWSHKHLAQITVRLWERGGIGTRGPFYDHLGALRDVGQNHVLQMAAAVLMEEPKKMTADEIRASRAKAFKVIGLADKKTKAQKLIRAQYQGYTKEEGVTKHSNTETFFHLETLLIGARWRGVKLILESGKALPESRAEIEAVFTTGNKLTFRIQPEEGITLTFRIKHPGLEEGFDTEVLSFDYKTKLGSIRLVDAYEKLLFDAFLGDQTRFSTSAEVATAWQLVEAVRTTWDREPLYPYTLGTYPVFE
ncbi:MAG: glucose-6-phosphate dehydrogenase (NADP(+)) [Candidatus Vogelbacteria bacterium]|nr:glucose-6-phosphate dehydrogenase (NADP(+)) [Candidatus Vogelbacteria bacterium]